MILANFAALGATIYRLVPYRFTAKPPPLLFPKTRQRLCPNRVAFSISSFAGFSTIEND